MFLLLLSLGKACKPIWKTIKNVSSALIKRRKTLTLISDFQLFSCRDAVSGLTKSKDSVSARRPDSEDDPEREKVQHFHADVPEEEHSDNNESRATEEPNTCELGQKECKYRTEETKPAFTFDTFLFTSVCFLPSGRRQMLERIGATSAQSTTKGRLPNGGGGGGGGQ